MRRVIETRNKPGCLDFNNFNKIMAETPLEEQSKASVVYANSFSDEDEGSSDETSEKEGINGDGIVSKPKPPTQEPRKPSRTIGSYMFSEQDELNCTKFNSPDVFKTQPNQTEPQMPGFNGIPKAQNGLFCHTKTIDSRSSQDMVSSFFPNKERPVRSASPVQVSSPPPLTVTADSTSGDDWTLTEADIAKFEVNVPASWCGDGSRSTMGRFQTASDDFKLPRLKSRKATRRSRLTRKSNLQTFSPLELVYKATKMFGNNVDAITSAVASMGLPLELPCMQCYEEHGPGFSTSPDDAAEGMLSTLFGEAGSGSSLSENGRCKRCGGTVSTFAGLLKSMVAIQDVIAERKLVIHDVHPDGNCFFSAVIDQMRVHDGPHGGRDADELRLEAVQYLRDHPDASDGTPLSAFLTTETWEEYLSRMSADGEWADHMVINAVAEVLQRTLVVIGGSTGQLVTEISPTKPPPDPREPLCLGHLGESHYVSLRPRDWTDPSNPEVPSDRPKCDGGPRRGHFFPLKHVDCMLHLLIKADHIKSYYQVQAKTWPGALSYGLKDASVFVVGLFISLMLPVNPKENTGNLVLDMLTAMLKGPLSKNKSSMIIPMLYTPHDTYVVTERADSKPTDVLLVGDPCEGTVRLSPIKAKVWQGQTRDDDGMHVLARIAVDSDSVKVPLPPLYTIGCSPGFIMAFWMEWPPEAAEWVTRDRPGGYPTRKVVAYVYELGCHVVPAVKDARYTEIIEDFIALDNDTEWSLTFARAEQVLSEYLTSEQKACFILFKHITIEVIGDIAISNVVTSSVFFYACEQIAESRWTSTPGTCILIMMKRLLHGFRTKTLPHYFMSGKNILKNVPNPYIKTCCQNLERLFADPLGTVDAVLNKVNFKSSTVANDIQDILKDISTFSQDGNITKSFFSTLYQVEAYAVQLGVESGKYADALSALLDLRMKASEACGRDLDVESMFRSVMGNTDIRSQWCFALHVDLCMGTVVTQRVCDGKPSLHISEVFGPEATSELLDTAVPELAAIENGDVGFAYSVMSDLISLKRDSSIIACLKFYLREYSEKSGDALVLPARDAEALPYAATFRAFGAGKTSALYASQSLLITVCSMYVQLFNACLYANRLEEFREFLPRYRVLANSQGTASSKNLRVIESYMAGEGARSARESEGRTLLMMLM